MDDWYRQVERANEAYDTWWENHYYDDREVADDEGKYGC